MTISQIEKPRYATLVDLDDVYRVQRYNISEKKDSVGNESIHLVSKENYFSIFDDESKNEPCYNSFTGDVLISEIPTVLYSLVNTRRIDNCFVESKRFLYDIIFYLDDSRVLEIASIGLFAGMIASLMFLPLDFVVSASLLLAAPLFVSLCGIFAKYFKRKK